MHCLNLKVTYECSNNCSFCFSSYLKNNIIPFDSLKEAIVQGNKNGCDELVLSGGEPTLYPNKIIDLINLSKTLKYKKIIIQTNGYGLFKHEELVPYLNNIAKTTEVCVSFSVHGHTPEIHDYLCNNHEAFISLIGAIEKINKTNCKIYTNTVINSKNINYLKEIASLISSYNPKIIQFSMMHLKEKSNLSVSLEDSVKVIKKLKDIVSIDVLKTEGIPYCLLYGMEKCVAESAWPSVLDLYNNKNVYISNFNQLDYGMRKKIDNCKKCIMDKICFGVWKEHFEEFSNMRIRPIA